MTKSELVKQISSATGIDYTTALTVIEALGIYDWSEMFIEKSGACLFERFRKFHLKA